MDLRFLTFDEFVHYGIMAGGNVVNRMPWSFVWNDYPVTHENDNAYLITTPNGGSVRFERGMWLASIGHSFTIVDPDELFHVFDNK